MTFCSQSFKKVEIYENGDVYTCCPVFTNHYLIGNIYTNTFDEIWNGEKATFFRQKMLDRDFSLCSDLCPNKTNTFDTDENCEKVMKSFPIDISVSSDDGCNVKCRICRDEFKCSKKVLFPLEIKKEINNIWLPIFKDAQIVRFGCSGESLSSQKERELIKAVAKKYPQIKFQIHTNGVLGNKRVLENLNIYNRISILTVSLHSATRETYNKIVLGGNYDKVLNNLKLYAQMKKDGLIDTLRLIFVVYSENFHEMPLFVELAREHGAIAQFWAFRKNNTEIGQNPQKYNILDRNHPQFKDFVEVLQNKCFDEPFVTLYPEIKEARLEK